MSWEKIKMDIATELYHSFHTLIKKEMPRDKAKNVVDNIISYLNRKKEEL